MNNLVNQVLAKRRFFGQVSIKQQVGKSSVSRSEDLLDGCDVDLVMALNSAMRVCARVQIPVCPQPPHELLCKLRTGYLVVSPLRIACAFLHWERDRSSKQVWRSQRPIYLFLY
jgi:hypothetical protein